MRSAPHCSKDECEFFISDLQSLLMYTAVLGVVIKGVAEAGSFSEIWRVADEGHRIEFFKLVKILVYPIRVFKIFINSFSE